MADINYNKYTKELTEWYRQSLGQQVAAIEAKVCQELLPQIFGYHALQIGLPQCNHLLASSPIKHRVCLSSDHGLDGKMYSVRGLCDDIPFKPDSIDLVIMPHVLEALCDNKLKLPTYLSEVVRVLIPEGHLVLIGFNRRGFWGVRRVFSCKSSGVPWNARFISMQEVIKTLKQFGCDIKVSKTEFFMPPFSDPKWLNRFSFLEHLGSMCWPKSGGIYILVAKKKVSQAKMVGVSWRKQKIVVKDSIAEPTTRSVNSE